MLISTPNFLMKGERAHQISLLPSARATWQFSISFFLPEFSILNMLEVAIEQKEIIQDKHTNKVSPTLSQRFLECYRLVFLVRIT